MRTRRALFVMLAAAGTFAAGAIGVRALMRSPTVQVLGTLVSRVDTSERVVALTFDDGPTVAKVAEIIDVLATRGVQSTFFVNGGELALAPEAGRQLVAAGHELGNHSYTQQRMVFRTPGFVRDEIERTDALIRAAGHRTEVYVRPPGGYKLLALPWYLWRTGRTAVTWDMTPDAYPDLAGNPEGIAAHVKTRVRPGSIIVLHPWRANRAATVAAVPRIIDDLRGAGFRLVTVGQLMTMR